MHVYQTFSLIAPEEYKFSPYGHVEPVTETRCPTEKLVVLMDGKLPLKGTEGRRPSPLWSGTKGKGAVEDGDNEEIFVWQQDKLRLPDETRLRPTSLPGCVSLLRLKDGMVTVSA